MKNLASVPGLKDFSSDAGIPSAQDTGGNVDTKKLRQSNSNWINSQIANICGRKERKTIFYTLDYFLTISIFWYQIGSRLCKMNTLTFC